MISKVYFRVDGNEVIGIGHVKRCITIAKELTKLNVKPIFIVGDISSLLKKEIQTLNFAIKVINPNRTEIEQITGIIIESKNQGTALVIDNDKEEFYKKSFQIALRENGVHLVFITFLSAPNYYADVVINQNVMALEDSYSTQNYTTELFGPKYLVLHENFRNYLNHNDNIPFLEKRNHSLIFFGGADTVNRTLWVYQQLGLLQDPPEKINIVITPLYPFQDKLLKNMQNNSTPTELYIDTNEMPVIMSDSKYAFTSGGLTCWELGLLNVTNMIFGQSSREILSGNFLSNKGFCYYLGELNNIDQNTFIESVNTILSQDECSNKMLQSFKKLLNKDGVKLVCNAIMRI